MPSVHVRVFLLGVALPFSLISAPDPSAAEAVATRHARAHLTFLADDLLEGRGTGTRGYNLAAAYVATQFRLLGLAPAGDDGTYRQAVPLLESRRDLAASRGAIKRDGAPDIVLTSPADFLARPLGGKEAARISGPAVFVGFGVHAPAHGYSDFEGIDLQGKIAIVVANAPAKLPGTTRAHHSSMQTKLAELASRGAVGVLPLGMGNASTSADAPAAAAPAETPPTGAPAPTPKTTPPAAGLGSWQGAIASARSPTMVLLDRNNAAADDPRGLLISASLNPARIDALFAHAPKSFADLVAATRRSEPTSLDLGVTLELESVVNVNRIVCHNVLARLPGSDPALAAEPIVVTCHLDHIGIGPAQEGDTIFNGAMDNGSGVSLMLAAAQQLAAAPVKPRRPILFAAVTAEEKGLLGSSHLARNPPAGVRFAANVNIDMSLFLGPLRSVIGYGQEHTTLGAIFTAVTSRLHWTVKPDPNPAARIFVRSDQYSFVREGIPSLYLHAADESTDPAIDLPARNRDFMRTKYHKRGDDLTQDIHYESMGSFAVLTAEVIRAIADSATPPAWQPGDFFGETFGRK